MSDDAETREALSKIGALFRRADPGDYSLHGMRILWDKAADAIDAHLAALPPVAGPEVRPDETLRAAMPHWSNLPLWDAEEARRESEDPIVGLWRALNVLWPHLRAALAAPAPAPGDEGLRGTAPPLVHAGRAFHRQDYVFAAACDESLRWSVPLVGKGGAGHVTCPVCCALMAALTSPAPAATEVGEGE